MDFSHETWRISELIFAEDMHLPVDPDQIQIGDVVIIPSDYEANIQHTDKAEKGPGYLEKISGTDFFNEIKNAFNKVLPKQKETEERDSVQETKEE